MRHLLSLTFSDPNPSDLIPSDLKQTSKICTPTILPQSILLLNVDPLQDEDKEEDEKFACTWPDCTQCSGSNRFVGNESTVVKHVNQTEEGKTEDELCERYLEAAIVMHVGRFKIDQLILGQEEAKCLIVEFFRIQMINNLVHPCVEGQL